MPVSASRISAKVGWDPEPRKKKNAVAGMFASRPTLLHGPISGVGKISDGDLC